MEQYNRTQPNVTRGVLNTLISGDLGSVVRGPLGGKGTLKRHKICAIYPFMVSNRPQFPEGKLKSNRCGITFKLQRIR